MCASMICLALLAVAQIVSAHDWCERLPGPATAELRVGAQPALLCHTGTGTLELNVAPAVVMIGLAVAGLAVGVYAVVIAARRTAR